MVPPRCVKKKKARRSVKEDTSKWLNRSLDTGDWGQVRRLRKPRAAVHAKLRDSDGILVDSEQWADVMATHLEQIRWRVRPATIDNFQHEVDELPVCVDVFIVEALKQVVHEMKNRKAAGHDETPAGLWKAVCDPLFGLSCLAQLCKKRVLDEAVPKDRHRSRLRDIFKKGDVEQRANWRSN